MVKDLRDNGFDGEIISWTRGVDRNIFKSELRKNQRDKNLLCVSRVSKEKNLEDFFKLDYPGYQKIMVGDGPMLDTYQKQYSEVTFTGFKTGIELASFYANADAFVFPSRWETFGIVMIEAMACGTPVAAYPCQGPLDVVDQNITGYLDNDLKISVDNALTLDRKNVANASMRWSWDEAWHIFRDNMICCK
jgi:glycosyltransferase involved in cell wall biosynthesis